MIRNDILSAIEYLTNLYNSKKEELSTFNQNEKNESIKSKKISVDKTMYEKFKEFHKKNGDQYKSYKEQDINKKYKKKTVLLNNNIINRPWSKYEICFLINA